MTFSIFDFHIMTSQKKIHIHTMKIFVTGCLHAEWDLLCDTVDELLRNGEEIDLIIVNGDAETFRDESDLLSFTAPKKYMTLGTFYKIYNGERRIPRPTIVIGGNHEACDFFHTLPFGGWLAPNVFYTGRAASLMIGEVSLSAISGIFDRKEYFRKVDEVYPLREKRDLKTCYHIRAFSDFQLFGLPDTKVMLSHDWPAGIPSKYGGKFLLQRKKQIVESDNNQTFGLPKGLDMMSRLKPQRWYAAHHHIYFKVNIDETQFIANSKPPKYWYIIDEIETQTNDVTFKYRGEWLSILKATSAEMADPAILNGVNWDERWEQLRPQMVKCDDCIVGEFELDPFKYTSKFCSEHNIYCPVKEIRDYMESHNTNK